MRTGTELAEKLRQNKAECEFADPDYLVLMVTPENRDCDFDRLIAALGKNTAPYSDKKPVLRAAGERKMSIRQAMMLPRETVGVKDALGRICAAAGVGCPPAIPVAVPGEMIGDDALHLFEYYGIETIDVIE